MIRILKKALIGAFFYACALTVWAAADCPQFDARVKRTLAQDTVARVVDGDTLHTRNGAKLRLLHINTPELNIGKAIPPEALGKEAQHRLAELVPVGSRVFWQTDKRKQDKYSRILALVFNAKGDFVNQQMIASGLAHSLFIAPNFAYWRCIREAERRAKQQKLGLWRLDSGRAVPAHLVKANLGFQLVSGVITAVEKSRRNTWYVLDNRLWLGVAHKDRRHFANRLTLKPGQRMAFRAYVYYSNNKLRAKIQHPAQLVLPSPLD